MDEIAKHVHEMWMMDRATLGVIAVLCLVAAYALKDHLANSGMVIFAWPVLFLCSVLAQYVFMLMQFYAPHKVDHQWLMWTVFAGILGNIAGIALVAGLGRASDAIRAAMAPSRPAGPAQGRR